MEPFREGWRDRAEHGLLRAEQLYRRPWWKRWLWRMGWEAANVCTSTPLRTKKGKAR